MPNSDQRRGPSGAAGRLGRALGIGAGVGAGVLAAAATAVGIGGVALARRAVTPVAEPESPVTVLDITRAGDLAIARISGTDAELPGKYSLLFDGNAGHARLGDIIEELGGPGVARPILGIDRGDLRPEIRGRITGWWYTDPAALGLRTERITYQTELGPADAWLVHPRRAKGKRWAVHVHGRGALPEETIRGLAPLARAGITSLVISYRNDPGAPAGRNGRYGIGVAERRDVDAAVSEAVRRGAERVTLVGWSMGGTACLLAATAAPEHAGSDAALIDGLVLDSPAIDWADLLRYHARTLRAPRLIADLGIGLLGRGLVKGGEPGGIAFDELDADAFARALRVPALIHASRGDTFVPPTGAERLAAAAPELVQLSLADRGEHVKIWNVDPESWEARTEQFVRALPRPAWRG
ncbi:alpha/beta hydrolase [Leucobacter luti]|uniref:alpha/beta hydrolase n=1 Tax=Leucobacter luti TaxID=340320 RepID=UPI003CFC1375